jgi:hypothetical protein
MTTMDGNVSESDWPTVCSSPRISIIFLVSIIICSSRAIFSASLLSSSSWGYPNAAAVVAPAAAVPAPLCLGSSGPRPPPFPPPAPPDSSFASSFCSHSGYCALSRSSFVWLHPLPNWSKTPLMVPNAPPASSVAPSLVRWKRSIAKVPASATVSP